MYWGVGFSAKKSPPQSVLALRRAEFQLAVPLKLRIAAPLMRLVFQARCSDAASRKTISSGLITPPALRATSPHRGGKSSGATRHLSSEGRLSLAPLSGELSAKLTEEFPGFTASARKGWACWEASAAGFQLPRLSGCGAFPAVFVIAFGMELNAVYHQKNVLSSAHSQKQGKNNAGELTNRPLLAILFE